MVSSSVWATKEDFQGEQETSLKRKREPEPNIPFKKLHTDAEELKKSLPSKENPAATPTQSFLNFEDYKTQMEAQGLPLILMVGCGHGAKYKHAHLNCWCINLEKDPSYGNMPGNTAEIFKPEVRADEILDITDHSKAMNKKITRENIPYHNIFDVIVLERPLPATLNKPWTLWNVANMLKVGGEVVVDTCDGYRGERYSVSDENPFHPVCVDDTSGEGVQKQHNLFQADFYASDYKEYLKEKGLETLNFKAVEMLGCHPSFYGEEFDVAPILKKLTQFGIQDNERIKVNHDMRTMADFLARWFFKDIINVMDVYQPYTINPGQPLETARKTRIISATKTQETEDALNLWQEKIRAIRGHILWK